MISKRLKRIVNNVAGKFAKPGDYPHMALLGGSTTHQAQVNQQGLSPKALKTSSEKLKRSPGTPRNSEELQGTPGNSEEFGGFWRNSEELCGTL